MCEKMRQIEYLLVVITRRYVHSLHPGFFRAPWSAWNCLAANHQNLVLQVLNWWFPINGGTPRSSILDRFSSINHPFFGYLHFRKLPTSFSQWSSHRFTFLFLGPRKKVHQLSNILHWTGNMPNDWKCSSSWKWIWNHCHPNLLGFHGVS